MMAKVQGLSEALGLAHQEADAAFYPALYSMVFPNSEDPWDIETIQDAAKLDPQSLRFKQVLILLHETNHMAALATTAFGFHCLQSTERAVLSFLGAGRATDGPNQRQWDIAQFLAFQGQFSAPLPYEALNRQGPGEEASYLYCSVRDRRSVSEASLIPIMGKHGGSQAGCYFERYDRGGLIRSELTAASLLEALAVIAEVTTVAESREEVGFLSLLAEVYPGLHGVYGDIICLYLDFCQLPQEELPIVLPAIIDLALMHAGSMQTRDDDKAVESGFALIDLFLSALQAANELGSFIQFWQSGETVEDDIYTAAENYQEALCASMGMATTRSCTEALLHRILRDAPKAMFVNAIGDLTDVEVSDTVAVDAGTIDYRVPLALHFRALQARLKVPGLFVQNLSVLGLYRMFDNFFRDLALIDPDSKKIINTSNLPLSVFAPQALLSTLKGVRHHACPFQEGDPFRCASGKSEVCWSGVFSPDKPLQLCPSYLLGTVAAHPQGDPEALQLLRQMGVPGKYCTFHRVCG